MKRWVYAHRSVTGDPATLEARFRAQLPELLGAAAGQQPGPPAGDGSFLIHLHAGARTDPGKDVRVRLGVACTVVRRVVVPVTWAADPGPQAFPSFEGTVELEPQSSRHADLVLIGFYEPPVGPLGALVDATLLHGLAPRTIEHLAEGLARALTDIRGVAAADLDPVPMRVRDVMSSDPLVLQQDMPLRTAAALLLHFGYAGAPVVGERGDLVGVLSEADLLEKEATRRGGLGRAARRSAELRSADTVGRACSRPARVTDPDTTLHDAAREMLDRGVARLVVVDGGRLAGVVSRHDVLRALVQGDERVRAFAAAVLAQMSEPDVTLAVDDGRVTISGTISRLSRVQVLQDRIEAIDGVTAVDTGGLRWHVDDVTPLLHPLA